jgi:hypothetical protein
VPEQNARTSGENDAAGFRWVGLICFLKISDRRFPKLGISHGPKEVSSDTETQEEEDQAN